MLPLLVTLGITFLSPVAICTCCSNFSYLAGDAKWHTGQIYLMKRTQRELRVRTPLVHFILLTSEKSGVSVFLGSCNFLAAVCLSDSFT